MRSKIKLSGDPIEDLNILNNECSNNNQICYHIKNNRYIIDYLILVTGLDLPVMQLFYHYKEGIKEIPKCACGDNRQYHCYGYRPTCGKMKCQNIVREESKKKYCLDNYGVEYVTQLDSMKKKSMQSCIEKFGVDNITKCHDIIKKRKENNFKKYGVTDPIVLKSVRGDDAERGLKKIQSGLPDGYIVLESDKDTMYKLSCPNGHIFDISKYTLSNRKKDNIEICNQCNEYIGSNVEQELYNYISSIYFGNISRSNRKLIAPFEIDMVLEDIKICIEFNGDYWHSININDDQYYHLNKLNMCLSKGYKLLQIRENDWYNKKDLIKRKLYNIINNIIDIRDFNITNEGLVIDLSWYDDRVVVIPGVYELYKVTLPGVIKVGQYSQWDCGYRYYRKPIDYSETFTYYGELNDYKYLEFYNFIKENLKQLSNYL